MPPAPTRSLTAEGRPAEDSCAMVAGCGQEIKGIPLVNYTPNHMTSLLDDMVMGIGAITVHGPPVDNPALNKITDDLHAGDMYAILPPEGGKKIKGSGDEFVRFGMGPNMDIRVQKDGGRLPGHNVGTLHNNFIKQI